MTQHPRFTVLLPAHNRDDVVGFAIQSVLAQSESDFELLVVADGCTDRTVAVAQSFEDPRIRIYDLPKSPYFGYANRNIALKDARGEIFAYAAHDDIWLPDHLARMRAALADSRRGWAYSRPVWVSNDGVIMPVSMNLTNADEMHRFMNTSCDLPASTVACQMDLVRWAGGFPENVPAAADWELWKKILQRPGVKANFCSTPTTLHFAAIWKTDRHSKYHDLRAMLAIADHAPWWPEILKIRMRQGVTEQSRVWTAMQKDADWVEKFRTACDLVTTRLAWDTITYFMPMFTHIRERLFDVSDKGVPGVIAAVEEIAGAMGLGSDFINAGQGKRGPKQIEDFVNTLHGHPVKSNNPWSPRK